MLLEQQKRQLVSNLPAQHNYATTFANGGLLDSYAGGGNLNTFADNSNPDNTTVFANGGTHETNPNSGIPISNNALVEENEVRFGDYIFSDRIPFKKK
jgi:hypothetical protein